jgi:prolyl-tRNA editing enzyme YbaK/EbsC (Cys-tRNA(Pro) deacylase)
MSLTDDDKPEGFQTVTRALRERGHPHPPLFLDVAARTSQEAADALGIAVGQVAKSVIFRRKSDDAAVLVVASGDRRVDEKKVAALVGAVGRADAAFVKARTGFSIGGVAPLAHTHEPVTLIDRDLFRFEDIWAAAGHPNGVFKLSPPQLEALTGAPVVDVVHAPVPSPCTNVCRMNARTGWCEGCYRTIDEIATWSGLTDQAKRAVWEQLDERRVRAARITDDEA